MIRCFCGCERLKLCQVCRRLSDHSFIAMHRVRRSQLRPKCDDKTIPEFKAVADIKMVTRAYARESKASRDMVGQLRWSPREWALPCRARPFRARIFAGWWWTSAAPPSSRNPLAPLASPPALPGSNFQPFLLPQQGHFQRRLSDRVPLRDIKPPAQGRGGPASLAAVGPFPRAIPVPPPAVE